MGIYSDYLNQNLDWEKIVSERKRQLKRISELRDNRAIFSFVSARDKNGAIEYNDLISIID